MQSESNDDFVLYFFPKINALNRCLIINILQIALNYNEAEATIKTITAKICVFFPL